jgi:zinc/manganese transport system substrate-binding protein/zinc transport system substrate-binding protein
MVAAPFSERRRFVHATSLMGWIALLLALATGALAQPLPVVATTSDLASLASAVGGEHVEVTSIVPPSVDAEEYQAKPQDAARLKGARVLVRVGLDYDLWLDRLLKQGGNRAIQRGGPGYADASYAIAVLDVRGQSVGPGDGHAHGSGNPHYWLDPKNAEIVTGTILETLARVDPTHAASYEANRMAFLARLAKKLADWEDKAAALKGVPIVAYHNTWAYFARRFRLDFVGFIELKPGVPPPPSHLSALIATMKERGVRIVVREPHEPQRTPAFVAEKAGATVVTLASSVGALPEASDYLALFDANIDALVKAR